jgi:hypothetical protein
MRIRVQSAAAMALLGAAALLPAANAGAQGIDFDRIDKFQSLGSNTLHVGEPPRTIVDDNERHAVALTIWDADAETKITWRDPDTKEMRTTVMPGRGIQTFQTLGVLKLEATGEPYHEVKFGYVLLGMKK